jgi:hypothetical protein
MGHGHEQPSGELFHDVSPQTIKDTKMLASEALQKHLENAQAAHRVCLRSAKKDGVDPVDKCALTWHEVWQRYRAWAIYRAPFQDEAGRTAWTKAWPKKAQEKFDRRI